MSVQETYGNRLRVRVCGLMVRDDRLLMVNHRGLTAGDFWAPPGGGIEFGESAPKALERELREETGLRSSAKELLFTTEFINPPLHAIEMFFRVEDPGGIPVTGTDPESGKGDQLIKEVAFLSWDQLAALAPDALHGIFRFVAKPIEITGLKGFFSV